jgi:hypothetical protein
MTTFTVQDTVETSRPLSRPAAPAVLDRLRTRFAASLAERRADRAFRAQERAFAGLSGAAHAEALAAARRA